MKRSIVATTPAQKREHKNCTIELSMDDYQKLNVYVDALIGMADQNLNSSLKVYLAIKDCPYPAVKADAINQYLQAHIKNQGLVIQSIEPTLAIQGMLFWKSYAFEANIKVRLKKDDITDPLTQL
tara:strand:- start:92286 stop:92660 length:375 start_codon:yes stop_codon:yes gene_type:complete